jgi:Cu+-exporting ATPase
LSRTLRRWASRRRGSTTVRVEAGRGVSATRDGKTLRLGSPAFLAASGVALGDRELARVRSAGHTLVGVAENATVIGWITVADAVRADAASAVAALRKDGVRVLMLTGDHLAPAAEVARLLGIGDWRAEQLPQDKRAAIVEMQQRGHVVGMLATASTTRRPSPRPDVSFAMGAGAGSALSAADVTLLRNDLHAVAAAIELSRATLSKIRQNLFLAFIYNVLGVPLAALGLLSPVIAGAAMAASSVSVVGNALLLRRWNPPRAAAADARAPDRTMNPS